MGLPGIFGILSGMPKINSHRELRVYQNALAAASFVFLLTLKFPKHERYGAIAQILASSRSVCANIAEAWRKRRYPAAFRSKLNEVEGEAAETQVWLDIAADCGYITKDEKDKGIEMYEHVIAQVITMLNGADNFAAINPHRRPHAPTP